MRMFTKSKVETIFEWELIKTLLKKIHPFRWHMHKNAAILRLKKRCVSI